MSEGSNTARADLWGGAAWVSFGLWIVMESLRMDRFEAMGAVLYTMPGFVPGLIGSVIVLLGALLMLRGWRRRAAATSSACNAASQAMAQALINGRVLVTVALALVYAAVLIGRAPFWAATTVFVTTFVWCFAPAEHTQAKRLMGALLTGLCTAVVVTVVFQYVFLVRLP